MANVKAALATGEAAAPPLQTQIAAEESQLELLLAAQPDALRAELTAPGAIPPIPPLVPLGLPSEPGARRPDIREAEAQLHAAVARQGVAVASLYPRIALTPPSV